MTMPICPNVIFLDVKVPETVLSADGFPLIPIVAGVAVLAALAVVLIFAAKNRKKRAADSVKNGEDHK
jgi:hypothetical protein